METDCMTNRESPYDWGDTTKYSHQCNLCGVVYKGRKGRIWCYHCHLEVTLDSTQCSNKTLLGRLSIERTQITTLTAKVAELEEELHQESIFRNELKLMAIGWQDELETAACCNCLELCGDQLLAFIAWHEMEVD